MSTSSQFNQQADRAIDEKPEWLNLFLERTFFDACQLHHLSKNKVNKYCIDCNLAACVHCISSGTHVEHKILKIYRHMYKDVVALSDMEKYMDCSKIQPYKCNKQLIIAMNPLPHCGSSSNTNQESSCSICTRRLMDPTVNCYCSIVCKVEAFARKRNNSEPPFLTIRHQSPDEGTVEVTKDGERRNRRKGIPHKAPC